MIIMNNSRIVVVAAIALLGAAAMIVGLPQLSEAGGDWNDSGIQWQPYTEGLAAAKEQKKPVCLVFYTDWCPHCGKYSGVFHDPAVIEESKKFVMIRLNKDENAEVSAKYAPDGEYIPRTFFLSPSGELDADITEQRPNYKYFYDTANPAGVLRAMEAASKKYPSAS
jgi:thiol:disulfide interchange protein